MNTSLPSTYCTQKKCSVNVEQGRESNKDFYLPISVNVEKENVVLILNKDGSPIKISTCPLVLILF